MSASRYWTVDEARDAIPRLREILAAIRRVATLATQVRSNGHAAIANAGAPRDELSDAGVSETVLPVDIQSALDELQQWGIVLRDPSRGLVDFPAMHNGREVQLCWQLGEEDLGWWHFPDAGFAGRRPLPLPEEW